MPDEQTALIEFLAQRVLNLQKQIDESALNEIALIATLKELVPGFDPRFDQLRKAAKSTIEQSDREEIARLFAAWKKKSS